MHFVQSLNFWMMRRGFENGERAERWEGCSSSSRPLCCLSYSGENHPPNASENWIAGLFQIVHSSTKRNREWESLEHLQGAQQ